MNKLSELIVSVRTLEVNGKSMTLAFFRQLPISRVYNENEFTLRNVNLWGIVRYKIPGYLNERWVVFEEEGILYKGNVDPLNNIPSIDEQESEVEYLKETLEFLKDETKHTPTPLSKIETTKNELVKSQIKLLKYINGHELVKKINSLLQLFIAI